jgi:hypothetical protein
LTAVDWPAWHKFKQTFILDRGNLRQFIEHYRQNGFDGKFVLCQGKLALHEGDERRHRQLLAALPRQPGKEESVVAAYCSFKVEGRTAVFTLDDKSGQYGRPALAEFARAAAHLATELVFLGFSSQRMPLAAPSGPGFTLTFWLDKNVE